MKVKKITPVYMPFNDHFKKEQKKKKEQLKKDKPNEQPKEKKDSNFVGWA